MSVESSEPGYNPNFIMTSMISKSHLLAKQNEPTSVPEGHPLVQMGFEGSRHLIPERMPSARRGKASSLRVIDMNDDTTKHIKEISGSLRRLDLSNLHLVKLNEDFLDMLVKLERLDISHNELSNESFPQNFAKLEHLIELNLHENKLTSFPEVCRMLRRLTRVKLSGNNISDLAGLEKLKRLQVLVIDNNDIPALTKDFLTSLKKLEILHCAYNEIKEIPGDIRNLRYLKDLDISNNNLTSLPPEVLLLPRIEVLCASSNDISRIPTINVKGRVTRKLVSIDLSSNSLIKFPEHLLYMTDRLDLSRNRIKALPGSLIQKLDWGTDKDLILDENPLVVPPQDICECGIKAIMQYFNEAKAQMKLYQGLKVLVLGASKQGKTSLIQSIIDQQSRLTAPDEATSGADCQDFVLDIDGDDDISTILPLNLSLWDFSGNPRYLFQHTFFMEQPSLVLLVFNMAEYTSTQFQSLIGVWIDCIVAKTNKIVILPVATHRDKVPRRKVKTICEDVHKQILTYIEGHKKSIQKEIQTIESMPHISPALSEQLKNYLSLLKVEFTVHSDVVPVSSTLTSDVDSLVKVIQDMACNKEFFPDVMKVIPSMWGDVENYVEDRGYAMAMPVLKWDNYLQEMSAKFGMRNLMKQITQYLHDTGKVMWFSDHPLLKDYVFLRPSWVTDLLKNMFRHDVGDMDYTTEESFKQLGVNQAKFEKFKKEVLEQGVFDKDYLKCVWSHLIPPEVSKSMVEILMLLTERFEIGYPVHKNDKPPERGSSAASRAGSISEPIRERLDSASTVRSVRFDRPERSVTPSERSEASGGTSPFPPNKPESAKSKPDINAGPAIAKIVVPWLRNIKQPKHFKEEYDRFVHRPSLAAFFRFPKFVPPGIFEVIIVRTLKSDSDFTLLYNWNCGLYVRHKEKPVRFYLLRNPHDDGSTCIRLETRLEEMNDSMEKETDVLWSVMLPILKSVEELLAKYAGVRVERSMECPNCHAQSFFGEWNTPKELQSMTTKQCDKCHGNIDACFLIQPKERRRVEELILMKKKKQEAERRKVLAPMSEEAEQQGAAPGQGAAPTTEQAAAPVSGDTA